MPTLLPGYSKVRLSDIDVVLNAQNEIVAFLDGDGRYANIPSLSRDPFTGKKLSGADGVIEIRDLMYPPADSVLSKYGRTAQDICLATTTVGTTTVTHVLANERPRFSTYTRKATIGANTLSELRFPNLSITADPDDQSLSIDIYIEQMIGEFSEIAPNPFIAVNLSNDTPLGSNYRQWGFGASYLRQGWNTLKMRAADDVGAVSSGNLPFGVSTTTAGTGCNFALPIQYLAIQFTNMNGHVVHIDQVRRSAKAKPVCVFGFDASGASSTDNIFVDTLGPLFKSYGTKAYVTFTNVYELILRVLVSGEGSRLCRIPTAGTSSITHGVMEPVKWGAVWCCLVCRAHPTW